MAAFGTNRMAVTEAEFALAISSRRRKWQESGERSSDGWS